MIDISTLLLCPVQTKFLVSIGIFLSICPFVRLSVRLSVLLFVRLSVQSRPTYIFVMEKTGSSYLKQRLWPYFNITLFVEVQGNWKVNCKIHVRSISFFWEILEVLTAHKYCLWPEWMPWFIPKVIWASSTSFKEKVYNLCLLFTFLIEKHWKYLRHIDMRRIINLTKGQLCKFKVIVNRNV